MASGGSIELLSSFKSVKRKLGMKNNAIKEENILNFDIDSYISKNSLYQFHIQLICIRPLPRTPTILKTHWILHKQFLFNRVVYIIYLSKPLNQFTWVSFAPVFHYDFLGGEEEESDISWLLLIFFAKFALKYLT